MSSIEIKEFRNAVSLSADNKTMQVEINHPQHGWIPYALVPHDEDMTIDNVALLALIKNNFIPYTPPTQAELDEEAAVLVRMERDRLLTEVDVFVSNPLRWQELTSTAKSEWAGYRLALLDISNQEGFPHIIDWPVKPS